MLTPGGSKQARFIGAQHARGLLSNLQGCDPDLVESVCDGIVDAVGEYLGIFLNDRRAYELIQRAADRIGAKHAASAAVDANPPETRP